VEYGDATTTIDPIGADAVAQAFPRTYGQRLVTFLAPDAGAEKAVEERPPIRSVSSSTGSFDRSGFRNPAALGPRTSYRYIVF
jgi:hypothetical protein